MSERSSVSETEVRGQWRRHLEFVVMCVGYAVGLGNVWRFPHLCYSNGGGAFLIPYFTCLVALGMPIFFLEIAFGQFSSASAIAIWQINPLFKGLGYTMVFTVSTLAIYYNVVIAVSIYFMFASMQSTLPWSTCNNEWNTCYCRPVDVATNAVYNISGMNCTGVVVDEESRTSPSHEYYYDKVLEITSGIEDSGGLKWDLTLLNFLIWTLIFFTLNQGVRSMGRVTYFSALLPYVLMTVLLVKSATLPGAAKGVEYYMSFDIQKILNAQAWRRAASQILFSLSCCLGSLTGMSSYNQFHDNTIRDSFVIPLINCGTSFYVGFAIFTTLGYMGETTGRGIETVATSGPGLVFVAYPVALSKLPLPQMWSFFFFLMMVLLGLGSQFPNVESIITAVQDEFPWLRKQRYNKVFRLCICLSGFLLGLPQTTRGGMYLLDVCDTFIEFPMLFIGLLEVVAIVWIYGVGRFSEDMMLMLGFSKYNKIIYNTYFKWGLIVVTPLLITWIILYNAIEYKPISAEDEFPEWAEALGWLLVTFIMMWTVLWYIITFCQQGGFKLLVELNQPTSKWGPADPENRMIPRYQYQTPMTGQASVSDGTASQQQDQVLVAENHFTSIFNFQTNTSMV